MACISAETGTYIFAIINIIVVSLGFTVDLGVTIYVTAMGSALFSRNMSLDTTVVVMGPIIAGFVVLLLASLITLVFSSLLLDGLVKKKPGYVKAYFVYGVIVIVMTLLALIGASAAGAYIVSSDWIAIVIAYVIYGLILYMIRCAYTKMETVTGMYAPKPLVTENEYC